MADIKVSQLQNATSVTQDDMFMLIQNNTNKKITLKTLLGHMDTPVVVNSKLQSLNLVVNGLQPNLLCTNAATNSVGILTNSPENAALQVIGDIRVGGVSVTTKQITKINVGAANSGGTGYKKVVVYCSTNIVGVFNANNTLYISGLTVTELNGFRIIGTNGTNSFKFNVSNGVTTASGDVTQTNASATKNVYKPGVFKSSLEQIVHTSADGTKSVTSSFSITGMSITGSCNFSLISNGSLGQEKYIYLKSITSSDDKATFDNVNGVGFNRLQFRKVGDAVTLQYDGEKWVCIGVNGATISTV